MRGLVPVHGAFEKRSLSRDSLATMKRYATPVSIKCTQWSAKRCPMNLASQQRDTSAVDVLDSNDAMGMLKTPSFQVHEIEPSPYWFFLGSELR